MTGIKTIEDLINNSTLIGIDPDKDIKELLNNYKEFPTAMQGLGYKEVVDYLNGKMTKEEIRTLMGGNFMN